MLIPFQRNPFGAIATSLPRENQVKGFLLASCLDGKKYSNQHLWLPLLNGYFYLYISKTKLMDKRSLSFGYVLTEYRLF